MQRLVRFQDVGDTQGSSVSWGIQSDQGIHDVGSLLRTCPTILDAIRDWDVLRGKIDAIATEAPLRTNVRLLSPVPDGGKVLCIGLNYRDHALETGADIPGEPVVFNKLAGALCGPEDKIPIPAVSREVDYEAELVMVIGREAWQVKEEDADPYIFGYTCGHDVSARDWQKGRPGGQWMLGKSFPNFGPIGPCLIPKEFVSDPCALTIQMRIGNETLQDSSTRQLIFNPWQLIAYLTQCCVLKPGDVIFTGTPPGVGAARKPPRFLKPGDQCEVEVQGIGILRNYVV